MDEDYNMSSETITGVELSDLFNSLMDDVARLSMDTAMKPQYKVLRTADVIRRLADAWGRKCANDQLHKTS